MQKAFVLILSLSLFLTACGGGGSASVQDSETPLFYKYVTAEFSVDAPVDWETINGFTAEYPQELRVAFLNNVKESDHIANLNVIREGNADALGNLDWSQKKLGDHKATVINYRLLSQEEVNLAISKNVSNSVINTFEGKNEASEPTLIFMQTYLTKGDQAWTATASYQEGEDPFVVQALETMLKSFTVN